MPATTAASDARATRQGSSASFKCAWCGAGAAPIGGRLALCASCGAATTAPAPDAAELDRAYSGRRSPPPAKRPPWRLRERGLRAAAWVIERTATAPSAPAVLATLAGPHLDHPLSLIPAREPCAATRQRLRHGWIVLWPREVALHLASPQRRLRRQPEDVLSEGAQRGADVVVMLHPDGQYEPELIPSIRFWPAAVYGIKTLWPAARLILHRRGIWRSRRFMA